MSDGVLSGRTALVTGAGAGMGHAHAKKLASLGARVIVQDIREEAATEVAGEIDRAGGEAITLCCDVSDTQRYVGLLNEELRERGGIDILVNNAGVSGQSLTTEAITPADYDTMLDVNLRASFFAGQALIPSMKDRGWGRIINISSVFALKGSRNAPHYTAAKAALLGLTKAWALELAPWSICVNAVAPGLVKTELVRGNLGDAFFDEALKSIPLGKLVSAEDVAETVGFLAGPGGATITGQTISVNAGDTIVGG